MTFSKPVNQVVGLAIRRAIFDRLTDGNAVELVFLEFTRIASFDDWELLLRHRPAHAASAPVPDGPIIEPPAGGPDKRTYKGK